MSMQAGQETVKRARTLPWSATRVRTFQECRRKYYFRYHLAPLARKPGAPAVAYQVDRVKDLVGLEAWAGDLVHHVIETALNRWRARRDYTEAEALAQANRMLSSQYRDSHDYWSAHPDSYTRRPLLLDMHYYSDAGLSKDRAQKLRETVHQSLRSFFRSHLAGRLRALDPGDWRPIDRNASAHLEDGTLILVKPDFAFVDGERLVILDWKTGRPDPYWEMIQVTCYALYAAERWHYSLERIDPKVVHLFPEFRISDTEYSWDSIQDVKFLIRESQSEIVDLVGSEELPPEDRFPCTEDGMRCRWCQFRGVCEGARRDGG